MANPNLLTPIPAGFLGTSSRIKIGQAANINLQADDAARERVNGRYDFVGPVYRGDLLSPQFLLRPIIIHTAQRPQPQRSGVVTEVSSPNQPLSTLDRVRNLAR